MPMKEHEALISKLEPLCGEAAVPCLRTVSVGVGGVELWCLLSRGTTAGVTMSPAGALANS